MTAEGTELSEQEMRRLSSLVRVARLHFRLLSNSPLQITSPRTHEREKRSRWGMSRLSAAFTTPKARKDLEKALKREHREKEKEKEKEKELEEKEK